MLSVVTSNSTAKPGHKSIRRLRRRRARHREYFGGDKSCGALGRVNKKHHRQGFSQRFNDTACGPPMQAPWLERAVIAGPRPALPTQTMPQCQQSAALFSQAPARHSPPRFCGAAVASSGHQQTQGTWLATAAHHFASQTTWESSKTKLEQTAFYR